MVYGYTDGVRGVCRCFRLASVVQRASHNVNCRAVRIRDGPNLVNDPNLYLQIGVEQKTAKPQKMPLKKLPALVWPGTLSSQRTISKSENKKLCQHW